MSRSFKKHPWGGDHKGKDKKRASNHKVRNWLKQNPDFILKGGNFKKIYESWDICDYGWLCSWERYWDFEIKRWKAYDAKYDKPFPNKEEVYKKWLRYYHRK